MCPVIWALCLLANQQKYIVIAHLAKFTNEHHLTGQRIVRCSPISRYHHFGTLLQSILVLRLIYCQRNFVNLCIFLKEQTTKSQCNLLTPMNNFGIKFQDLQDLHKIVKMKNYGQRFVSKLWHYCSLNGSKELVFCARMCYQHIWNCS